MSGKREVFAFQLMKSDTRWNYGWNDGQGGKSVTFLTMERNVNILMKLVYAGRKECVENFEEDCPSQPFRRESKS